MHLLETARNHAGTHDMGRLPGIVLEQAGTPATWQDGIGKHEPRQINQLPHVIAHAQMLDGEIDYLVGILPGQAGGAADAQMLFAILAQGGNNRALPQQGFHHQRFTQITIVIGGQPGTGTWVANVIETPDIQRGVRPRRQHHSLDHLADARLTRKQEHVTRADFPFQKLEITQCAEIFLLRDGIQPVDALLP